jgi:transcriptional regulator with XRE-family HTH domain
LKPLDAERVKEWRHRRMLSQQEVADRAETSLFTIQRIERGEGNVRPKTGRGVAAALSVPIEELLPKAQAYELARDAARRQATQNRQAANRALESGRPQTYFMRHENDAAMELSMYPPDELAGALLEATAALEDERPFRYLRGWRAFVRRLVHRWEEVPPKTSAEISVLFDAMAALVEQGVFDPSNVTSASEQSELQLTIKGFEALNEIADSVEKNEQRRDALRVIRENLSA